jgi:arginine dihydrolase
LIHVSIILIRAFAPWTGGELLWFPPAFDRYGQAAIREVVPTSRRLEVGEKEAARFACNAVSIGKHVLPERCPKTISMLEAHGYMSHAADLSEFLKAGGAAKCLTLALD